MQRMDGCMLGERGRVFRVDHSDADPRRRRSRWLQGATLPVSD